MVQDFYVMAVTLQCIINADWEDVSIFGPLMSFIVINATKSVKNKFNKNFKKISNNKTN